MSSEYDYLYDPETEQIFEIKKNISLGRSDSNDFSIKDQSISSKHARLFLKEGEVFVEDLNSFNSTYINANECKPEVPYKLNESDVLQFGDKVFFFNSTKPNQAYLDLPGMTGSMTFQEKTSHDIVHDYHDPILDLNKKKKGFSLKNLRMHKEEIAKLQDKLEEAEKEFEISKNYKKHIEVKKKEMAEFNSYLKTKKYNEEAEVNAIIFSIEEVSQRIEKDKSKLQEKIDILKNQLFELEEEFQSLDNEKEKNSAMIQELNNDIEILKGRDALALEIKKMKKDAEENNEEKYLAKIEQIKKAISDKEKQYKKAQEKYTKDRFGNKNSLFGKKAS